MGGGGGFFSFVMPVVGALVGAVIPPVGAGLAVTASTMSLGGAAIGAGVGGTVGGLADGKDVEDSLVQGAVAGGTTYVGGQLTNAFQPSVAAEYSGGNTLSSGLVTAGSLGVAAGSAGGMASSLLDSLLSPAQYSLPDLPSFSAGDGLDFLDQDPVAAPDSAEITEEAERRRALLLEEETGPADLVLTSASLASDRPGVARKTLLGA